MAFPQKQYRRVAFEEAKDDDILEELLGRDSQASARSDPENKTVYRPWLIHAGIFTIYTFLFTGFFVYLYSRKQSSVRENCLLQQSVYSPALEAVEYSIVRFNGSLNFPSPYRGTPTRAVDEAWDRITTNNSLWPIRISDESLSRIKKSGRQSNVKFRESDGGGSLGSIEVFHQLHCLNLLRKFTYSQDYPEINKFRTADPNFFRSHLDHCIEIIRQNLICAADVGIISYDWLSGMKAPFPDFSTYHKCRNFDNILDWATSHRVHITKDRLTRIGDEVDLLGPPE